MTTDPNKTPSGGNDDPASGGLDDPTDKENEPKQVSYDTHRKLLGEKKTEQEKRQKAEQELDTLRKEKADREKAELEKQGNYKKLLEDKERENGELKGKLDGVVSEITETRKRKAILKHIGGVVPESAFKLLPMEMVELDADGKPTEQSAKAAAQIFQKECSFAIQKDAKNGGLPNESAPAGGKGVKITYAEWDKLSAAEMKKQYNNVDWSTAPK